MFGVIADRHNGSQICKVTDVTRATRRDRWPAAYIGLYHTKRTPGTKRPTPPLWRLFAGQSSRKRARTNGFFNSGAYHKRGLITEVTSDAGATYYTYDARGAVLIRALPNGTATYYSYDDAARLSTLENRKGDGTAICTFEFTRDPNGNILTSLREDDSCWYYEYDGLQRLTAAEWKDDEGASLYAYEYDYDKVGNRSHLLSNGSHTYYSYNPANELTVEETPAVETVYYTYDGRGNQTQRSVLGGYTTYFEYNSRNLITRIDSTDPAFTTPNTFEYNGLGQRVQKVDSTGTTKYLWDAVLRLQPVRPHAQGNWRRSERVHVSCDLPHAPRYHRGALEPLQAVPLEYGKIWQQRREGPRARIPCSQGFARARAGSLWAEWTQLLVLGKSGLFAVLPREGAEGAACGGHGGAKVFTGGPG